MQTLFHEHCWIPTDKVAQETESKLRSWLTDHAGTYRGQARKELNGTGPNQYYQREGLTLAVCRASSTVHKKNYLYSANYKSPTRDLPYTAYALIITGQKPNPNTLIVPNNLTALIYYPNDWSDYETPWQEADLQGNLQSIFEDVRKNHDLQNNRSKEDLESCIQDSLPIAVLTKAGAEEPNLAETIHAFRQYISIMEISDQQQLDYSRLIPDQHLQNWVNGKAILFNTNQANDKKEQILFYDQPEPLREYLQIVTDRVRLGNLLISYQATLNTLESICYSHNALTELIEKLAAKHTMTDIELLSTRVNTTIQNKQPKLII